MWYYLQDSYEVLGDSREAKPLKLAVLASNFENVSLR